MRIGGLTFDVAKTQVWQIDDSQEHILFLGLNSNAKQSCVTNLGVKIDEKMASTDWIYMKLLKGFPNICQLLHVWGPWLAGSFCYIIKVYVKSVLHYGVLLNGCTSETHLGPSFSSREKTPNSSISNQRSSTEELFEFWGSLHIRFV